MTIHEAGMQLRFSLFHLYDEREAGNITDLVMEHITGWKKIDRIVNKTVPLTGRQQQMLSVYTIALLDHAPVQYVLKEAWFYGMSLFVDENVLIPRPETEELADWLLKETGNSSAGKNLFDIGTGSGCIALAIKKTAPGFTVHACDISEGALLVARKNAADNSLDIQFHQLDILSAGERNQLPAFDILVSNPPYIPQQDKSMMADNVLRYEPSLALFVPDNDALLFYKAIADFALHHLKETGLVYLEVHEGLAVEVANVFRAHGFTHSTIKKDLQGKQRMVRASRQPV